MLAPLHSFKSFIRPLYEFLYPPTCFGCDGSLESEDGRICADCWNTVRPISPSDSLFLEMNARLSESGVISGLVSAFHFEKNGTVQRLVHQLKYEDFPVIGIELGKCVGGAIGNLPHAGANVRLIPVPLHSLKKRERGYNQSDYIAKGASIASGLEIVPFLLQRRKKTLSQTTLTLAERQANVDDAFEVAPRFAATVSGASFVMIDDVITTGATVCECARVLKENGALHVYAASIALADHATIDNV